jgi:D-alanine transaminase
LHRSLGFLRINIPADVDFQKIGGQLIEQNNLQDEDTNIYIQVTRGCAKRKHAFPDEDIPATLYASVSSFERPVEKQEQGVKVVLVPDNRWTRCDIKSISLLPNVMASQQAKEANAEEALFVRDDVTLEGSHSSFCGVFNDCLTTAPKSNLILPGITREVVLQLCRDKNITVDESPISTERLKEADELMLLSTSLEVTPIVQVDDWKVGNGEPGAVTRRLQRAFEALITETG